MSVFCLLEKRKKNKTHTHTHTNSVNSWRCVILAHEYKKYDKSVDQTAQTTREEITHPIIFGITVEKKTHNL